ncbi:DNA polymerase Y family protein [Saccharospirillum sp. HFRX-1]|uniref:Y-family DNA polymerase n=1 Tax=unclassified Saccharospirillum TaxID=2633430 RepID=UPI003717995B
MAKTVQPLWLYLHFPLLALEARFGEVAQTRPVLLTSSDGRSVQQCNALARSEGVQPGMSLRTAYCLVDQVAQASYSAQLEATQLRHLAVLCYQHCADIRLCSPLGLSLEIGSMLRWHGGLETFIEALDSSLQHSGHNYQLALGHTPLAARLLAENHQNGRLIDAAAEQQQLGKLSIDQLALPLDARDLRALAAMGLKNLRQLRQAPRSELGYRFGQSLINHLAALERPREQGEPFQLPPCYDERLELWHEVDSAEALIFPIKRLLHGLAAYLNARQLSTTELHFKLEHRDAPITTMSIQLNTASRGAESWPVLVALALERLTLPEAVLVIGLRAEALTERGDTAGDLLGDSRPQTDAQHLLSLLRSKLGAKAVQQPSAGADWRPNLASRPVVVGQQPDRLFPRAQPTLLLANPEPINAAEYQALSGPQRFALPAWVQPDGFQRDYYRAWHPASRSYHWISRHSDGGWYREGVFA